ncbi:Mce-associated membrane protein [Prauserella sediminis]|uniref:Mce-associated membrane protein n=1 Tax=Prauserella sediminis TaxID=577680 RepID=A0A839XFX0_9PSEU|nr:hypothetical protein [Prauserella sediminis]MBB3662170.1 Mce-associated membrane protein [Prauserella sediminis]
MSPNRRKPTPQQRPTPTRRPKVAGLRKPGSTEDVETSEQAEAADTTDATDAADTTDTAEAAEAGQSAGAGDAGGAGRAGRGASAASEPEDETGPVGDRDNDSTDSDSTGEDGAGEDAGKPAPRPGPRRKAKDDGRAKPASLDEAESIDAEEPGTPAVATSARGKNGKGGKGGTSRRRPGYAVLAVLVVAGLLLAGAAVFFQIKGSEARAATSNSALVDGPATAEVKEAMGKAAERLFSIDHNNLDKTEKAADELLAGGEVKQKYDALMGEIKRLAPEQKIVVTVHATRSAVVNLDDERARVMVFIDQAATRPSDEQPAVGGAAMWLETQKQGDTWKVTNLDTYAAQQPAPAPGQSQDPSGAPLPGDGQQGGQNGGQQGGQDGQNGGEQGGN